MVKNRKIQINEIFYQPFSKTKRNCTNTLQILSDQDRATKELETLEGKEYWNVMLGLIQYSLPKLSSTEFSGDGDFEIHITREIIGPKVTG